MPLVLQTWGSRGGFGPSITRDAGARARPRLGASPSCGRAGDGRAGWQARGVPLLAYVGLGRFGAPPSWLFVEVGGCGAWRLSRWEPARLPALAGLAASSGALLWPCQVAQRTGRRLGPLPAVGWGMRGLRVCTRNTGTLRQRCSLPADAPHPLIPHWASASSVMAAGASPPPHAVTGAPRGEKPRAPHPLSAPRFGAAQRGVAGRRAARKHRAQLQGGSEEGGF